MTVPAARGSIVDRDGRILAGNRTSLQVAVQPPLDDATLQRLSELAGTPRGRILARTEQMGSKPDPEFVQQVRDSLKAQRP